MRALALTALLVSCAPARPLPAAGVAADAWSGRERTRALEKQVAALLAAPSDRAPSFSHDGRWVVFLSSRDGLPQLYVSDTRAPASPARRLVSWPSPISSAAVSWDDRAVIFTADQDGDEQVRLFRTELESGAVTPLTPEPLNRDTPLFPERQPGLAFYSARALGGARSAVYATALDGKGGTKRLYEDEGAGFLVDVSADGGRGLFVRFRSHQSQELVLVDLATGRGRSLYPAPGAAAAVAQAAFAPDGRTVYVATDAGGEGAWVLALSAEDGRPRATYREREPATAAPESLLVSRRGDVVAASFDAGDHTVVRLFDGQTLAPRARPELPPGVGELGDLTADGRALALCWETVEHPCALLSVSTSTGAASPLPGASPAGGEALDPVAASSAAVASFDGVRVPLNIYRPRGTGRRPVIVQLHGGPAGSSKLGWSATRRFFLSQGYAWVEPNIRGSGGFGRAFEAADDGPKRVDSFRDLDAVHDWVAAQPWADPRRLCVMGGSFGGYLVLNEITRTPDRWWAAVDEFGIADFATFMETTKGLVRENYLHELGDPLKDGALLRELSPIHQVERIRTPLFVYTGANDPRVPRAQSDLIVGALRRRGVRVEYMVAPDEGHGVERRENQIELSTRLAAFLADAR